jgi:hypothetical protein
LAAKPALKCVTLAVATPPAIFAAVRSKPEAPRRDQKMVASLGSLPGLFGSPPAGMEKGMLIDAGSVNASPSGSKRYSGE